MQQDDTKTQSNNQNPTSVNADDEVNIELSLHDNKVAVKSDPAAGQQQIKASAAEKTKKPEKSLTVFSAGLALLSATVGGGIVGIPFAMIHAGIPLGIALNIAVALGGWYTGSLYLKAMQLSPTYVESLYELGYVTMGSFAIYFLSVVTTLTGFGIMMVYFIVFSQIAVSLAQGQLAEGTDNLLTERWIYVLILATLVCAFCLMKRLAEMKAITVMLFLTIAIFISCFIAQLSTEGTMENHDEDYGQYYDIDFDLNLVTGLNIIISAYGYHTNLYPTYNSMGANKSAANGNKATAIGGSLSMVIYVTLGILSIYLFGEELTADVMDSVNEESNAYSYVIRVAFMIVLALHIPFVFFPSKESLLIIVDEAKNKSMSKALQAKLSDEASKENKKSETGHQMAYLSMSNWLYYPITLAYFGAIVACACLIDDLGKIFELVGAFGLSTTSFIMPGLIYLLLLRNPNSNHNVESKCTRGCNKFGAVVAILFSVINMSLVIWAQTV